MGAWICFILFLSVCLSPAGVLSGELSLILNGKAIHVNVPAGQKFNENNWGVGLQYDWVEPGDKWFPFANGSEFLDSNDNLSYYAGGGIIRRFLPFGESSKVHIDLGALAFLMYREGFRDGDLFPGVLPVVSVGNERIALSMTYIPKVDPKMVPLFFSQLKIGLPWLSGR